MDNSFTYFRDLPFPDLEGLYPKPEEYEMIATEAKICARLREIIIRTVPGIDFEKNIPNFPDSPSTLKKWMSKYDFRGWKDILARRPELKKLVFGV